jgi:hypothetical protein
VTVGAAIAAAATSTTTGAAATGPDAIPLLGMPAFIVAERDMPPAVLSRALRAQRAELARARASAKLKPTRAAGCVPNDYGLLGPPPPRVTARIFGRHVEVIVRFGRYPSASACRPQAIRVTTLGRPTTKVGPFPWNVTFLLRGAIGRAVIRLPPYSMAPYRLSVTAFSLGWMSKQVDQNLSCPSGGCMRSESYSPPTDRDPHRVLPLRGVGRRSLEESFRTALAVNRRGPYTMRNVGCRSVRSCEATYADPLFPDMPYRVRYRIEGEQRAGCWMARDATLLDPLPYEDTYRGSIVPAGCVSWLR